MNIIVGRNGKETVGRLSDALNCNVVSKHFWKRNFAWRLNGNKMVKGYRPTAGGVSINWAINPEEVTYDGIVYNSKGVALSSNKPRARMVLQQSGVSVPITTESKSEALRWVGDGKTIVCRPRTHRSGQNFFVINGTTSQIDRNTIMQMSDYYAVFFPKTHEYRAHCGHGRILVLQEKVPNRDGVDLRKCAPWNHATGDFVFKTVQWNNFDPKVCKVSLDAVKALGLDFGAVDIMSDDEGNVAVCEVNTSPSLEEYCLSRYIKYFNWLDNPVKREHNDYSSFTKGKSFAWKDCNFGGNDEEG